MTLRHEVGMKIIGQRLKRISSVISKNRCLYDRAGKGEKCAHCAISIRSFPAGEGVW